MAILVGFHSEGWDHLVLSAYLSRLLDLPETDLAPDWIEAAGRGWKFVFQVLPKALKRFYGKCAQFAVVSIDNDGSIDLDALAAKEDPAHPRHWLHADGTSDVCRWCQLASLVGRIRPELNWLRCKSGNDWPVLIAVPVEAIEAWLITSRALAHSQPGLLRSEMRPRGGLKQLFYGKPAATRQDVESVALPLIRDMTPEHLDSLKRYSKSFAQFARQVERERRAILGNRDCWSDGDRAAET